MKFKMIFVLLFAMSLYLGCDSSTNTKIETLYTELALDYFKARGVHSVVLFLCWKIEDRYNLVKLFNKNGIFVSFPNKNGSGDEKKIRDILVVSGKYAGGVFDSFCYNSSILFYQKYESFNASFYWLVFDNQRFEQVLLYVQTLQLNIVTDMTVTKTSLSNGSYTVELYDVYNPGHDRGGKLNATSMGEWFMENKEHNQKWKNFANNLKVFRRSNLNGLTIRAVTFTEYRAKDEPLESYLVDEHRPYEDTIFKMNYQLVLLLREMYNFTITLVLADNWTDKNVDGFYRSGNMMGILQDEQADITAGALLMVSDRMDISDVLHTTYPFRVGFVFIYSGNHEIFRMRFLTPFAEIVWCVMLLVSVIIVTTIWFIFIFEHKYLPQEDNIKWGISDTVLSVLSAWCQMGSGVRASTYASRIVYVTMLANALVLYNFYTSSIVSSLLNYSSQKFSLINLADSSMQCRSLDIGYFHNLLFDVPLYPDMAYFNSKKKTKDFYIGMDKGLRRVRKGEFAYHAEFMTMYNQIEKSFEATEICEMQEVDTIPLTHLSILAMKNSPYIEMFKVGLIKARETGQLDRLLLKWGSRKPICQASKGASEVGIHQIASVFFILVCGHLVSIAIFFYECKKWKNTFKNMF